MPTSVSRSTLETQSAAPPRAAHPRDVRDARRRRSRPLLGDAPVISERGPSVSGRGPHTATPRRPVSSRSRWPPPFGTRSRDDRGSVLAFLPGASEIRRTATPARRHRSPTTCACSRCSARSRRTRRTRHSRHRRRDGARWCSRRRSHETSLTIEGVRIVVDSGLARVPSFSPRTGMSRLETVRVSRASAEQRCGRAGRTARGLLSLVGRRGADRAAGARPARDPRGGSRAARARSRVGGNSRSRDAALDGCPPCPSARPCSRAARAARRVRCRASHHGAWARDGATSTASTARAHAAPRHSSSDLAPTACVVAALLDERESDPSRRSSRRRRSAPARGAGRIEGVRATQQTSIGIRCAACATSAADGDATLGPACAGSVDEDDCGSVLALAFPDRVARRRDGAEDRYLLRSGQGAVLANGWRTHR